MLFVGWSPWLPDYNEANCNTVTEFSQHTIMSYTDGLMHNLNSTQIKKYVLTFSIHLAMLGRVSQIHVVSSTQGTPVHLCCPSKSNPQTNKMQSRPISLCCQAAIVITSRLLLQVLQEWTHAVSKIWHRYQLLRLCFELIIMRVLRFIEAEQWLKHDEKNNTAKKCEHVSTR